MTAIAAAAFAVSIVTGASSLAVLARRMRCLPDGDPPTLWAKASQVAGLLIGSATLLPTSYQQTEGPLDKLANLVMAGEKIMKQPVGWQPYEIAQTKFRREWCVAERDGKNCSNLGALEADFYQEFDLHRRFAVSLVGFPNWSEYYNSKTPDFRNADMPRAFLAGAKLREAKMRKAFLGGANLELADLSRVQMQAAWLFAAELQGASLADASVQGVNFAQADLRGADLSNAEMEIANFADARMEWAKLKGAEMGAVDLRRTQMQGADLSFSQLWGYENWRIELHNTNLNRAKNNGGMLRFVDLTMITFDTETDFRNAFLDGSVAMTDTFRDQMGSPCQWSEVAIESDAEFYGRWRGWIELAPNESNAPEWSRLAPVDFQDVTAIPPPPGCAWKTGPMPGAVE